MSLIAQVTQALDQLGSFQNQVQLLRTSAANADVEIELSAADSLACAFNVLAVTNQALTGLPIDRLKRAGEQLSARLTYLLEPIHPIEVDRDRCLVQLRSKPPRADDDRTLYYELLLDRTGRVSLVRFQAKPGQLRQPIAAHVTREVLLRLIEDFAQASA